ncbi:hypothetical protein HPP92_001921 [Vanilla planifolia]|uniref:Protein kinase domain-containing protein n=1 Tax=Vanilla planifolia TaxID=51239 RepID=A0A835VIF9_VANPL|nr:hypothetical protein HPP92_001921 [Vanilla planifolia]
MAASSSSHHLCPLLLLPLLLALHLPHASSLSDSNALLLLKSSFHDPDPALSSWSASPASASDDSSSSSPCAKSWTGVLCFQGIVTGLRLGGLGLAGTINVDALSHFTTLRSISFINNNFSGPLPDIGRLDALKSVYLSNNSFSGPIPDSLFSSMNHLKKLWLDGNAFSGPIPSSLSNSSTLIELHLEGNDFTGPIPPVPHLSLRSINVSYNKLLGPIPPTLARFDASAFVGNAGLCGPPLPGPTCTAQETETTVTLERPRDIAPPALAKNTKSGLVVLLVFGILLLFLSLIIGYATVKNRRRRIDYENSVMNHREAAAVAEAMEAAGAASPVKLPAAASLNNGRQKRGGSNRVNGGGGAELVIVNNAKGVFGLQDLMRSAAEVLGNGGFGSAYKALMANGVAVAVKRMRELNRLNKEGFEGEMRRFGRLRHPNVLTPLAYHFRKEEKLVVSEYISKGSLLYILHGDKGADHAALDWPRRLRIIRGIARAMAYLHAELSTYELPHGNLKTGNVLLTPDFEPLLTDFGLAALVNPSNAPNLLFAYKTPEALQLHQVSPKSDVYCFGIVVLEILTGKFPSQYLNNTKGGTDVVQWGTAAVAEGREAELLDPQITGRAPATAEMVRLLRVAVACTQVMPQERPDMKATAEMVEEIASGAETFGPVGPLPSGPDGYVQLSGSSGDRSGRRREGSGDGPLPPAEQWSGDLLSL